MLFTPISAPSSQRVEDFLDESFSGAAERGDDVASRWMRVSVGHATPSTPGVDVASVASTG